MLCAMIIDRNMTLRLFLNFYFADNVIKRIFNILKFTWVLFLASLDSFTAWLNSICREHIDISTVLRIERCMLTREIKKVNHANVVGIIISFVNYMHPRFWLMVKIHSCYD